MPLFLSIVVSMLLLAGPPTHAQEQSRGAAVDALAGADVEARRNAATRLGEVGVMADVAPLVRALRDVDKDTRDNAEQALWRIWARSGDAAVDRLYAKGVEEMAAGELQQAIATFTRVIGLAPDFAEGWNKRATLYFLVGDLRKSLADCDEVIKRNPHHFGALAGYAQIYARLEYYDRALAYSRRALEVNPNMEGVRRSIVVLEHILEERRKRMI